MIKIIAGEKGVGKSKEMIELANNVSKTSTGHVVYIDDNSRNMFELATEIRFVNLEDFKIVSHNAFYGFVCGMISTNYDIKQIFVDGLSSIAKLPVDQLDIIINELKILSEKFEIDMYLCFNAKEEDLPQNIKDLM